MAEILTEDDSFLYLKHYSFLCCFDFCVADSVFDSEKINELLQMFSVKY